MSGYLYFPNNLKLPLTFYNSITFVFEAVFVSAQIVKYRFGALLGIRDHFITKLNVLAI